MNKTDFTEFTMVMYGLADNFSASITPEGMKFRFDCLSKYTLDQVKAASWALVKTRKFTKMPTIAEFIELIDGNLDDKAEEQAMKVLEEVRRIGSYSSPVFEDPKTQRIVTQMGWGNLCSMESSKEKWFVKDFIEAYNSESRRQATTQISGNVEGDVKRLLAGITKRIEA